MVREAVFFGMEGREEALFFFGMEKVLVFLGIVKDIVKASHETA